jgi:hypothetical protein
MTSNCVMSDGVMSDKLMGYGRYAAEPENAQATPQAKRLKDGALVIREADVQRAPLRAEVAVVGSKRSPNHSVSRFMILISVES